MWKYATRAFNARIFVGLLKYKASRRLLWFSQSACRSNCRSWSALEVDSKRQEDNNLVMRGSLVLKNAETEIQ
jgi:hypothetical protein